jgi:hypothetical protein
VAVSALAGLAGVALPEKESEAKPRRNRRRHKGHRGRRVEASAKPTCGKAGATCTASQPCCGTLICPNGTCRKASPSGGCGTGQIKCNGECTNIDNTNCGACGVTCESDESCVDGTCTCQGPQCNCKEGTTVCDSFSAAPELCSPGCFCAERAQGGSVCFGISVCNVVEEACTGNDTECGSGNWCVLKGDCDDFAMCVGQYTCVQPCIT